MKATTVGIDLAKNLIQVHGVDEHGRPVLRKQLKRSQVLPFFANLAPCLIGMEACSGAHHWGRQLQKVGHRVKLMAPQFVKPYVKTNKNDLADAEAICEAVNRPTMLRTRHRCGDSRGESPFSEPHLTAGGRRCPGPRPALVGPLESPR